MKKWQAILVALVALGMLLLPSVAWAADEYRTFFGLDPRTTIWVVAELHLMFAAFVLGVPIFAVVVEVVGVRSGDRRYDRLAHEFVKLLSAAFATTAALGGLMAFVLMGLYPTVSQHLSGVFAPSYYVYGLLFLAEAFCLYFYYYSWNRLKSTAPRRPRFAKVAWWVFAAICAGWGGLFVFGGPDLEGAHHAGEARAERVERLAEGLGPWLEAGLRDEEDLPTFLAVPVQQMVDYEASIAPHDVDGANAAGAELLELALSIADEKGMNSEAAAPRLGEATEVLAADARAEAGVAAAGLSADHWTLLLWIGLAGLLVAGVASRWTNNKAFHIYFGVMLNLIGTSLLLIANSWATYMMSPTGVHEVSGEFVGTVWQAVANPLWHPVNLHRLLANVVLGGFVAGAYAAVRFMHAKTDEERAHYDWMGYVGNFVGMCAMIPLPFAGYYLGREVYSYSPIMGNNMMGGAFSWTFILQALLIGILFFGANYYLWVGMQRIEGSERYRKFIPWNTLILVVSFAIWLTPHNLPLSGAERALMAGESFHPVLKYFGLMPAKNAVVNFIIVSTFFSFLMYRRSNLGTAPPFSSSGLGGKIVLGGVLVAVLGVLGAYGATIVGLDPADLSVAPENRWIFLGVAGALAVEALLAVVATILTFRDRGKLGQSLYFGSTVTLVTFFLGVWGFVAMTDASQFLRNVAVSQVLMVLTCLVLNTTIDVLIFRGAETVGRIKWGHIPLRSQFALILICTAVVMLMGLMGYIRSGLREDWHVYGVLRDTSNWAFTPTQAQMALTVGCITAIFFSLVAFVFWLANLGDGDHETAEDESVEAEAA